MEENIGKKKRLRKLPPMLENPKTNVEKVAKQIFQEKTAVFGLAKPKPNLLSPIQKVEMDELKCKNKNKGKS
jgi:hypothetical protein